MPTYSRHVRIILILAIGVILVFRSFMRPDLIIFGFDLIGLAGLAFLILGLVFSYHLRKRTKSLS